MRGFKPIYGIIAFIGLLLIITPWAKVVPVNVLFTMGVVAMFSYATGVWIGIGLRDSGRTVIFMKDSIRRSNADDAISRTIDTSTEKIPGLVAQPYGGFEVKMPPVGFADKSLAVVPSAAVEQLSDKTMLVYAPTSPLVEARFLKGIADYYAKLAEADTGIGVSLKKKTLSEIRFGLLNGLVSPITTEALMEQQSMINSSSVFTDLLEEAEMGEKSNVGKMQKLIRAHKSQSPVEKAKSFIFGQPQTDTETDKPGQREPNA